MHGHTLATGKQRLGVIGHIVAALGDPVARTITPKQFIQFREERLKADATENHLNHQLIYIKAIYNELRKLGEWEEGNPLEGVKKLKLAETELRFLTHEEIDRLLAEAANSKSSDLLLVIKIAIDWL